MIPYKQMVRKKLFYFISQYKNKTTETKINSTISELLILFMKNFQFKKRAHIDTFIYNNY